MLPRSLHVFSHLGVFLISVKPLTTEITENKTTPKFCKLTVLFLSRGQMGPVCTTSWYTEFNGSHFGLPPSSIHRMTGLGGNFVWTMTNSHVQFVLNFVILNLLGSVWSVTHCQKEIGRKSKLLVSANDQFCILANLDEGWEVERDKVGDIKQNDFQDSAVIVNVQTWIECTTFGSRTKTCWFLLP